MPRVKSGVQTRKRRKKILKLAKGYFGSKRTLYRTANEQVMRSLNYAYISRRLRKRDFRKLWIQRINAACKLNGYQYSKLIFGLSLANVEVNRKMLADMAMYDAEGFKSLIEIAKNAIEHKDDVKPVKEVKKAVKKEEPKKVVKKEEPKKVEETPVIEEEIEELDAETLEGVELTVDEDTEDDSDLGGADFVYHISQVKDESSAHFRRWRVRRSGSTKTIKHFDTQKDAIVAAKRYATSNNTRIVVHGRDGQVRN